MHNDVTWNHSVERHMVSDYHEVIFEPAYEFTIRSGH